MLCARRPAGKPGYRLGSEGRSRPIDLQLPRISESRPTRTMITTNPGIHVLVFSCRGHGSAFLTMRAGARCYSKTPIRRNSGTAVPR
jgi:hypothetical protein